MEPVGSLLEQSVGIIATAAVTQAVEDRGGANADRNAAIAYGALGLGGLAAWAIADRRGYRGIADRRGYRGRSTLLENLGKGAFAAGLAMAAAAGTRYVDQKIAQSQSKNTSGGAPAGGSTGGTTGASTGTQFASGGLNARAAARRFGYGYGAAA